MKKTLLFVSFLILSLFASKHATAQVIFMVTDPAPVAATYTFTYPTSGWGFDMNTVFVHDTMIVVRDFTVADSLGCDTANGLANAGDVAGKIAVVYRLDCEFGVKALNAQNAGAVGVIIINNVSGAPVIPGAGGVGSQITIPAIMISDIDGALLRPYIDAGNSLAMIGNKTGVFANDLGAFAPDIVLPNSWAIPSGIATNAAAFEIPVGAWVTNYGQNSQSNVTLNATVTLGANVLYNQTSAATTINNTGDSMFIQLPTFSQSSYADGLYRLEYTISGAPDEFADDNTLITHFWIQPDYYSKSRWDTTSLTPIRTTHYRTADAVDEFVWCTVLDHPDASNLTAYGVSFSATAATTSSLAGKSMEVLLYEWNDVIDTAFTFNNLDLVASEFYDYIDNTLSGVFVTTWFPTPQQLTNTKYLTCVKTFDTDVFIGADDFIDYETSWDAYNPNPTFDDLSVFFPINGIVAGADDWNGVGFGSTPVPSIILHTSPVIGVEENIASITSLPYPNPGSNYIYIPLNTVYNGKVIVNIYDLTGRTVKSEVVNMNNTNNFRVGTTNLTSGIYQFSLKFSDNSVVNFPVMINR